MGRHQVTLDNHRARKDDAQKVELLGWGLFLTAVAAAGMTYIGLPAGIIFLIASVGLAAFVLIWVIAQLHSGEDPARAAEVGSVQAALAAAVHRPTTTALPTRSARVHAVVGSAGSHAAASSTGSAAVVATGSPAVVASAGSPAVVASAGSRAAVAARPASSASAPPVRPALPPQPSFGMAEPAKSSAGMAEPATAAVRVPTLADNRLRRAPASRREARSMAQFGSARYGNPSHAPAVRAAVVPAQPAVKAARAYETSPAASSWTKTFGAPDTGSIPIQPYAERPSAGGVATAKRTRGKHQMSHSRL